MTAKWYEEAQRKIGKDDEILKAYEGRMDGTFGYITISNKRMMFLHEKGLFRQTVDLVLDLPYNQLGKISHVSDRTMDITEKTGEHHTFKTDIIKVSKI